MLAFQGTYPLDKDYWVSPELAHEYPVRYGDLFSASSHGQLLHEHGKPWPAVMILHPTCDLGAKAAPSGVQVVRVDQLDRLGLATKELDVIRAGFREKNGQVQIAYANLVYLAPVPQTDSGPADTSGGAGLNAELVADLRITARLPLDELLAAGRAAAMSHDARVAVIRREVMFRYRWPLSLEQVAQLEQARIQGDGNFTGPRPGWAAAPNSE